MEEQCIARKVKIKIHSSITRRGFIQRVERAKQYIAAGDIFQVVLSQRLDFIPEVTPFDIYRSLRAVNPSPYMYFLRMGDTHVLGSSPEMLVRVTGRKLEYRPIAGTHPRGRDEAEDQALEKKMLADEKERAEHVMLVDLGRNDLGRVSEYGSVKVRDLMYVERYSHVMHIVSALEGKLRDGLDALDAFAACFPAGTLSGAPKCGPCRSSKNWSRPAEPSMAVRFSMQISRAIWIPALPSAPCSCKAKRLICKPARASWPTPTRQPNFKRR